MYKRLSKDSIQEFFGYSTEVKPTSPEVSVNDTFYEMDTRSTYYWDGTDWKPQKNATNRDLELKMDTSVYDPSLAIAEAGGIAEYVSKHGQKSKETEKKCVITIIDDDGTNRTNDSYTGLISYLNNNNIPLTLAVPTDAPTKNSGTYSMEQLHNIVNAGNEVVMHGQTSSDTTRTQTLAEFKTCIDASIAWATSNGFTNNVYVYPGGTQPDLDESFSDKLAYLENNSIRAAYNVNTSVENHETVGFGSWYTYMNGANYNGASNRTPFVTTPIGISKAFLLNRNELKRDRLSQNWWKKQIYQYIDRKDYIVLYMHSFSSEWQKEGEDGKTTAQLFKEFIDTLIKNYGDKILWKTASQALDYYDNLSLNVADAKTVIKDVVTVNSNEAATLEDVRTDRKLLWHEEFDNYNDEWSLEFDPTYKGVDGHPHTEEFVSYNNSVLTLKGKKITNSDGDSRWSKGHIHSKRGFKNCLVEYKAKGLGGLCLYSYQLNNAPQCFNLPWAEDYGTYSTEIDVAEYYDDSDQMSHFNVHSTINGEHKTKSVGSKQGYANTGFPNLTDDWHIFGVDMIDYKTFDFYVDREKIGTIKMTEDTSVKDFPLFMVFEAIESKANNFTESEIQIDWIRVYAHSNPENYVEHARGAEFISANGTRYQGGWDGDPAIAWTPVKDGLAIQTEDENGMPLVKLQLFLRILPENSMVGPKFESINLTEGDFAYNHISDLSHMTMSAIPKRGTLVQVKTSIGRFCIILYQIYNDNPVMMDELEASAILGNPEMAQQFFTGLQTFFDTSYQATPAMKLIDTASKENVVIYLMNGHLHSMRESTFNKFAEGFKQSSTEK